MGARGVRRRARRADDVDRRRVEIRRARPEDAPQLARLHAEAMDAGMALGAAPDSDLTELHTRALEEANRVVLVGERHGKVVGMAHLVRSESANATQRAEVQRVAVAAEARGTGVGRALMAAVEEEARRLGLTLLWLTTHANADAEAFYLSVGYTRLGQMPSYSRRPDGTLWPGVFFFRELVPKPEDGGAS